ncbi:hypothetical protein CHARACLAT_029468 [Characodon lateralis]|uniref:Uncharacterized protein n=1 Tax=Characodon lateralis TaxID=208331 RepID=A0ABU7DWI6_9TELE|nr:hypothetical protein [Characodon lateralis]
MLDLSAELLRMNPEEIGTGPTVPQSEVVSRNGTLIDQGYVDAGCQTELTMDDIEKMEDVLDRTQQSWQIFEPRHWRQSSTGSPLKKTKTRQSFTWGYPIS